VDQCGTPGCMVSVEMTDGPPPRVTRTSFAMGFLRAAAAAVFALVGMATTAAAQTPSPADQQCLACHGMPGLEKKLGDGETLPLQIAGDDFSKSVHAPLGCATCHSDVQPGQNHPPAENNIPSRRAFALERVQVWQTCHAQQAEQWTHSVHAALARDNNAIAPICTSCQHCTWLPNADLHLDVVSCPACHAPTAQRKVDLVLYNSATQSRIPEPVGVPAFQDGSSGGLDPRALLTLLGALNHPGTQGKTTLKGRLTVLNGPQAHELAPAAQAISDCKTCHQAGAAAFKTVTVSVAGARGVPIDVDANGNVLNSALSLQSVGGFYAIGGTRIGVLDILFLLAILGGIAVPIGHLMMKYAVRIYVARQRQARKQE